jgi:dephospho-CoA kinase
MVGPHPERWSSVRIVGLSGGTASGKTTLSLGLRKLGYEQLTTRAVVEELAASRGLQATRPVLRVLGAEIHQTHGQAWLFERVVASVTDGRRYVIDALRFPDDALFLRHRFSNDFFHIHLTASPEWRIERYVRRGGTAKEFDDAQLDITESMEPEMRSLADAVLVNDSTASLLEREAQAAVERHWREADQCP